jgi:protein gp37
VSAQTGIEWADSTFNPWIGCTKVSPACDHCYAERDMANWLKVVQWGAGQPRKRTAVKNWKGPKDWNDEPFFQCACGWRGGAKSLIWKSEQDAHCPACGTENIEEARRRVFCASLADVFDNEVPIEWLVDLLDLIRQTPNLDWLLLTKRIGNWLRRLEAAHERVRLEVGADTVLLPLLDWITEWHAGRPPANVWLGATVVNQDEADRDIPKLMRVPARVRFLSIEPMLGYIDVSAGIQYLSWIICGGESGPHARPMHPDWVRSLRDQCAAAGVPFLFKQWGEWAPNYLTENGERIESTMWMDRMGKKAAGRQLDGREHSEFPA